MKKDNKKAEERARLIDAIVKGDRQELARLNNIRSGRTVVLRSFYDYLKFTNLPDRNGIEVIEEPNPEFLAHLHGTEYNKNE